MENLVEEFIRGTTKELNIKYMPQATTKKIKDKWNIDVRVDKSSRIIDFFLRHR